MITLEAPRVHFTNLKHMHGNYIQAMNMLLIPATVGGGELSIYILRLKQQQQQQQWLSGSLSCLGFSVCNEHAVQQMYLPERPQFDLVFTQLLARQTISSSIMEKLKTPRCEGYQRSSKDARRRHEL